MKNFAKSKKKLAIVCTHPIQYYVPFYQELAKVTTLKVFFTAPCQRIKRYDPGFKKRVLWDLPLLKDYDYVFANRSAIKLLHAFHPDQIFIYGWPFRQHFSIMRKFSNKIWFRGDSLIPLNEHPVRSWLKTLFLKWVYRHTRKAFYVGSLNKSYFLKHGLQENQLVFAPHAVENSRFGTIDTTRSPAIRKHLKIPQEDMIVLFAGKFNHNKNPLLLLRAFCELRLKHTHLIFAGDGELKNQLKKITNPLPNVHLLPFQNQSEMPGLYQCCDLFCLPSKSETWGLSVNEAMAAGKAVLVSDSAGAAADLVDSHNGGVFRSNDQADLQKKLSELTISKKKLFILGQCSKKRIQNWSIAHQVQVILKELGSPYSVNDQKCI